jgi:hypothetical protein
MSEWTADELARVGRAQELRIAWPLRGDAASTGVG